MTRAKGIVKEEIINKIISMIIQGTLNEGDFLPSIRSMSSRYNISRGTVLVVYKHLESMGYIQGFERSGYRVVKNGFYDSQHCSSKSDQSPFDNPVSKEEFSQQQLTKLMQKRPCKFPPHFIKRWVSNYDNFSRYSSSLSSGYLQRFLKLSRGLVVEDTQLLLCSGHQEAMTLIAIFLQQCDRKKVVIVGDPCSPRVNALFTQLQFEVIVVPTDQQGLCVEALPAITDATLLCMPTLHYPTATRMSDERKSRLLDWAAQNRALLIEDDSYAMLGFGKNISLPLYSQPTSVEIIYLTELYEVLGTTYNLAILALPQEYINRFTELNQAISSVYPPASFHIVESFLASSYLMKYLTSLIEERYTKSQLAKHICTEQLPTLNVNYHEESGFCYFSAIEKTLPAELINTVFFPVKLSSGSNLETTGFLFPFSLFTQAELEKVSVQLPSLLPHYEPALARIE
ncbi:aminotransferase class I/II-fold pyridoxal phosphate-dependent enzyme [Rosenbergiella nectarea]|uniref:aminotransferase class I/II-fold pyridoxal phosphate-dependent enzyme n=1 Tax=Rosenbergiella nectarea TaxID=988801 RepID=UPI001F4E35FF|nr:PLP-dependent aminotransferase family protein [Rosenbergiella nectarea]